MKGHMASLTEIVGQATGLPPLVVPSVQGGREGGSECAGCQ